MPGSIPIVTPVTFSGYADGIRIGARYAKPLARSLQNARPDDADAAEKRALKAIGSCASAIDETLNERVEGAALREPYLAHANAWGSLFDALAAKTRVPTKYSDVGPRAQAVLDKIGGLNESFVRLEAPAAWSEGDRRLHRIVSLGIAKDIDDLVGSEHLVAVRGSIADLGDAIGAGDTPREVPSTTALQNRLYAFSKAVAKYCRLLAAKADEDDPDSIERFRKAVAPIDEYRSRAPRSGADDEATDATDVTDVEATDEATDVESAPTPQPTEPITSPTPAPSTDTDPTLVD